MTTNISTATRPGLWPSEFPRHTESEAEQKVYKALKTSLHEGWYAWHSLRLRTRERGEFSEADFIIADPNVPGILILEVKGGQIEQRDGRWYQNSMQLKSSPLDQAFSFRKKLVRRFEEEDVKAPTIGVAACFPDVFFDQQPAQDDIKGLVIGGQDIPYLNKILSDVMTHAIPDPWPVKGPWIRLLHALWGETWIPDICLGGRIEMDEESRLQLDHAQVSILENLEENNRLLIKGSAGTGKTLLAREAALRETRQGKRVLFLCYTEALAAFLNTCLDEPGLTVAAVRNFASDLLGGNAPVKPVGQTSEYWENVSLRAAVDGLPAMDERWDTMIVDEGQDFSDDDWELVKECVHPDGKLWVFADRAQAFWSDRGVHDELVKGFMKYSLKKPYRCHPAIQHLDECYTGQCEPDLKILRDGLKEEVIRIVTSSEGKLLKQIAKEINRLLSGGLKPADIAVLSLRGRGPKEGITHKKEIGGHPIVLATDPKADKSIICETFLRFKGLERPAVIVTDLRLVSDLYKMRIHIAVSRALSLLRIVGVETEIRNDSILAKLI